MGMDPPAPWWLQAVTSSSSPSRPSRPASVTTNDGSRRRVTSVPSTAPMNVLAASPRMIASHHGIEKTARHDLPADGRVVANREVDLAQQEHEHLGHPQHDDRRALDGEVDQVAR